MNWIRKNKGTVAAAALVSGGLYLLSQSQDYPKGEVQSTIDTSSERFHAGTVVGNVLRNHEVTYVIL